MFLPESPCSADQSCYCFLFLQILLQHCYLLCLQKNDPAVVFISLNSPIELHFLFKNQESKKTQSFSLGVWVCGWFFFLMLFSANTLVYGVLKRSLSSLHNWESPGLVLLSIKRWLVFPGRLSFPIGYCTCFAFRVCGDKSSSKQR